MVLTLMLTRMVLISDPLVISIKPVRFSHIKFDPNSIIRVSTKVSGRAGNDPVIAELKKYKCLTTHQL